MEGIHVRERRREGAEKVVIVRMNGERERQREREVIQIKFHTLKESN